PERSSRIPAQPRDGVGRRDRLSRLANPARPAVPGAEALVRNQALRRGRPAASHLPAHRIWAKFCPGGGREGGFRARGSGSIESNLLPPSRRGRNQSSLVRTAKPKRETSPYAHYPQGSVHTPLVRGSSSNRGSSCGAGVASDQGNRARTGG